MNTYEVKNFMSRREGGQGTVQFLQRKVDGLEFAVKFFQDADGAQSLYSTMTHLVFTATHARGLSRLQAFVSLAVDSCTSLKA